MRTESTSVMTGRVASNGAPINGPLSCARASAGVYNLYAPPGKKMLAISVNGIDFPQWAFVQLTTFKSHTVGLRFANQAATVEVDAPFVYTVTFAD